MEARATIAPARAMEAPLLAALVLICSVAITPDLADCSRANATAVMRVPAEFGNPVTCFVHGQAYLAQTSIGQELGQDERVRGGLRTQRDSRCLDPAPGRHVSGAPTATGSMSALALQL